MAQILDSGYVLIYAKDISKDYTLVAQNTIAVDDSYLVLSRGATYVKAGDHAHGGADLQNLNHTNDVAMGVQVQVVGLADPGSSCTSTPSWPR